MSDGDVGLRVVEGGADAASCNVRREEDPVLDEMLEGLPEVDLSGTTSECLERDLTRLVDLDRVVYAKATDLVTYVTELKGRVKNAVRSGVKVRPGVGLYAALEPAGMGPVRWKKVAHTLRQEYGVPADEFEQWTQESRRPKFKLMYGQEGDAGYDTARQLDLFTGERE